MGVSVVIPVHNSMKYLEECLHSVFIQSIKDIEIIIVENGSSDDTPNFCRQLEKTDKRIKYIELGSVGVSVARNTGVLAATKEWLTFLDSDDMLLPQFSDFFYNASNKKSNVIISDYCTYYNNSSSNIHFGETNGNLLFRAVLQYAKYKSQLPKDFPVDDFSIWSCWGKLFRTDFIKQNNIRFPVGISYSEDTLFCAQAYLLSDSIKYCQVPTYFYRFNNSSVTHVHSQGKLENNLELIHKSDIIWKNYGINCKEINTFSASKVIEGILSEEKISIENLKKDQLVKNAIMKSDYFKIIPGKRNSIKYTIILFYLKIRMLF